MFHGLKENFLDLKRAEPGRRFIHRYRQLECEPRWKRWLSISVGLVFLLVGGLLGFAPLLPGWVFGLVGLAMVVGRSLTAARAMDKMEIWARWRRKRWACRRRYRGRR